MDTKIPGRNQYKHIIYGPARWDGFAVSRFPAIRDAVEQGNATLAQIQTDKAAAIIDRAARRLVE